MKERREASRERARSHQSRGPDGEEAATDVRWWEVTSSGVSVEVTGETMLWRVVSSQGEGYWKEKKKAVKALAWWEENRPETRPRLQSEWEARDEAA